MDSHPELNRLAVAVLTDCKHFHWKFFPPLLSLVVRTTTTFQGDWFTENLQRVVFYTPKASRRGKHDDDDDGERACEESLFKGGEISFFFSLVGFGIFMVCAFFLIQHHHSTPWKTKRLYTEHNTATYTQFFPHRRFCWCFSLFFYNFCCFYFHSAAVQPAFDSVILLSVLCSESLTFFSGRNHSPIFILSSFVCEQRPQKVLLSGCRCCRCVWF